MIPLIDLSAQHASIKNEIDDAIDNVISKSQFIGGDEKDIFEKDFAEYCGKRYCVGTSSGSTALLTALRVLGIKEGDEVILPVNTFIATAFAISMLGGKPVFVDVNENDFLINPDLIENEITDKTKAIIPVHLHGAVCDMDKISEIAKKHNLRIIEDCAQAHGATYKGKKVPISDIGCFSFFPAKNLGALGDAGAVVCSDEVFFEKCEKFVNHGRQEKYLHVAEGFNFRLDNLQAAILNVKLKYLDSWIEKKRKMASDYDEKLTDIVGRQIIKSDVKSAYHLYVIRIEKRDALKDYLKKNDIASGIHYPIPLTLQPALSYLGHKGGDFPIAEKIAGETLSIPIFPELTESDQNKIIKTIQDFHNK